ncbi:CD209 antigen-like protein C [Clarias gariepinus]|uniref:CD209 antigen-like protein C n=1 Tax=Clarias gariepinus TaxID=13013 RepID=UPI00234DDCD0|nr:CD209 antigen-like protein C [Clarias gariepinus]
MLLTIIFQDSEIKTEHIGSPRWDLTTMGGGDTRFCRLCVGVLCVLLLTATTVLWIKFNNLTIENNQLQRERDECLRTLCDLYKVKCFNFSSSFYFMFNERKNWIESRQYCREKGADLVIINSREEQEFIIEQLGDNNGTWIGLSDREREGKWKWVDGTLLTSITMYWHKEEPNDEGNNEDCGEISTYQDKKAWNDRPCSDKTRGICEKKEFSVVNLKPPAK